MFWSDLDPVSEHSDPISLENRTFLSVFIDQYDNSKNKASFPFHEFKSLIIEKDLKKKRSNAWIRVLLEGRIQRDPQPSGLGPGVGGRVARAPPK